MRALIVNRIGEPSDVVALANLPNPAPGPGEVLVQVHLASVNESDLHVIRGRFGRQPKLPASPGMEAVGVVKAWGTGVSDPPVGTRVVLLNVSGTWRDTVVAAAERVIAVPPGVSDDDAAQALLNPITAWVMTMKEHGLERGEWLAQSAAGSTVGRLVLQLARSEGFKTINLVRRRAQLAEIAALGGDVVLCTEDADWGARLATAADGGAPSKAIDCVAGRTGATLARGLAPGGRLLVYGALSTHRQVDPAAFEMPVFAPRLIYEAQTIRGWFLFRWLETTPLEDCADVLRMVLSQMADGSLRLPPAKRHAPEDFAAALADAEGVRDAKPLFDFAT